MLTVRNLVVLSVVCVVGLGFSHSCLAANLVVNGDFAIDAGGWTMLHMTNGDDRVQAVFDGMVGYPAGSVRLERWYGNDVSTNGHRYYQFVPVTPGTKYYVRGQWKGDLAAGTTSGTSWAEVFIGFTADANTSQPSWSSILRYRKSWDGINNLNVSATGQWNWENFSTSPQGTPPTSFTAQTGQNFMVIALNLGGTALTPGTAQPYISIDNIQVIACQSMSAADVNMDCLVDITDMGTMISQWLTCNLEPASSCW